MVTVPLSICGALIPLFLGVSSLNIYTQVGLVTLIGLISKHGILIVEFANQLRHEQGLGRREAIEQAAAILAAAHGAFGEGAHLGIGAGQAGA
uniref:efflux RND transporter permease subunit n=1 Tax=Salmonella sp. E393-2 TaxID=3240324 RepID=UPI00352A90BC